ncbi:MAG: VIT and VWA domain-containing protein [Rickettsiales bacterium]|nr:VIT and VWA domain-containing protein [Rickettsiales bacterium]
MIVKRINMVHLGMYLCLMMIMIPQFSMAAGLLTPKGGHMEELRIKDHHVKVVVEDGYALTTITQTFHNPHDQDLEAIYSFPVPEKATVSQFTMWIDGKPIHGEVLEKEKARQVYEEQKAAGNDVGITEKKSFKTFDVSVSPVRKGQETKIQLGYIQPAHVDMGIGRYVYPLEEGGVDEEKMSFWTANEAVDNQFSFDLILRSSYAVDGIRLPNHPQAIINQNGEEWHVHIGNNTASEQDQNTQVQQALTLANNMEEERRSQQHSGTVYSLDTDIVVYYRHADNLPASVDLVTYKPDANKPGTFMVTLTPGMDLQPITEGRDWIFVLDISGSMQGKYHTLAEGVSRALKNMAPNERFRIVLFNDRPSELTRGYTNATAENVRHYINQVSNVNPNQGTNVFGGLRLALNGLDDDRTASIILVTDGVANVGVTQQKKFIELVESYDVRLFTFIMGNSANRPVLTSMTDASGGFAMNVSNSGDIIGSILLAKSKVSHQALHGASLDISGIKTYDMTPKQVRSLYRGQQLIVFGHYSGGGEAKVTLKGKISGETKQYTTRFKFPETSNDNPEIERLWAYATIEELTRELNNFGHNADTKQAITDLGVEYSLVTDNTSMVVVKEEVFKTLGIDRKNQKRLEREYQAQQKRAANSVQNRRVDATQPMFNHNRPTTRNSGGGGAGSLDMWFIMLLLPLLVMVSRNRNQKQGGNV